MALARVLDMTPNESSMLLATSSAGLAWPREHKRLQGKACAQAFVGTRPRAPLGALHLWRGPSARRTCDRGARYNSVARWVASTAMAPTNSTSPKRFGFTLACRCERHLASHGRPKFLRSTSCRSCSPSATTRRSKAERPPAPYVSRAISTWTVCRSFPLLAGAFRSIPFASGRARLCAHR